MGQMALGILYGVEAPDDLPHEDGEGGAYRLLMRWGEAKGIKWTSGGPKVRAKSEGGTSLLGVWVAVGGGGEDGAAHFLEQCMLLADVANVYARNISKAEKLWQRFAAWAEKEGVKLPPAKLWLTPCEVA